MLFEWSSDKAAANLKKHGVSFELAQTVFEDPSHLSVVDRKTTHEERWVTLGLSTDGRTLLVVHTYVLMDPKDEVVRIISARKATRKEREQYEKGI